MKHKPTTLFAALLFSLPLSLLANESLKDDPAYLDIDGAFDFSEMEPEVNVNLPKFLLLNALSDFDGSDDDPFAKANINLKELVGGIKLIRVVVLDVDDEHKTAVKAGLSTLKAKLQKDWTPIVSVPGENVHIYAQSNAAGDSMAGLALAVADGGNVVLANLIGEIPIGKIIKVASKLDGDMIPKELIEQLSGLGNLQEEEIVENDSDDEVGASAAQ